MGSTTLTVNTQNSPRMLVSLVRTLPDGTVTSGPTTVIQNNSASRSFDLGYIQEVKYIRLLYIQERQARVF